MRSQDFSVLDGVLPSRDHTGLGVGEWPEAGCTLSVLRQFPFSRGLSFLPYEEGRFRERARGGRKVTGSQRYRRLEAPKLKDTPEPPSVVSTWDGFWDLSPPPFLASRCCVPHIFRMEMNVWAGGWEGGPGSTWVRGLPSAGLTLATGANSPLQGQGEPAPAPRSLSLVLREKIMTMTAVIIIIIIMSAG